MEHIQANRESMSGCKPYQKVMVTSASGFLGSALIQELSRKNFQTTALYSGLPAPEKSKNISPIYSDLKGHGLISKQLEGVNTLIHLDTLYPVIDQQIASKTLKNGNGSLKDSIKNGLEAARNLVRLAEKSDVKQIVYISSIGATQDSKSESLQVSYEIENIVLNSKILKKIILRIPVLFDDFGFDTYLSKAVAKAMKIPLFYPVLLPNSKVGVIHINDVNETIREMITSLSLPNCGILEAVSAETNMNKIFAMICANCCPKPKLQITGFFGRSIFQLISRKNSDIIDYLEEKSGHNLKKDELSNLNNPLLKYLSNNPRPFPKNFKKKISSFQEVQHKKMFEKEEKITANT